MDNTFDDKTILVTGGTGSIGSEIVKQLLRKNISRVIVYSNEEIPNFLMSQSIRDKRLEVILGDVRDFQHLNNIFSKFNIDYIYHAAALKHVVMCEKSPIEPVKTNILGTQNLLDLAVEYDVSKTVFISTDKAVYPTNVMGATKFIAERLVLNANDYAKKGQAFSCIRFGNVANSRGSVIPVLVDNMVNGLPFQITDRNVTRFTMEIEDAVNLILKATQLMDGGEIFVLKMRAYRLGDLVDAFIRVSRTLNYNNIIVEDVGLYPGEKLHEELANSLELNNIYDCENMYVILPQEKIPKKGYNKIVLKEYSSKTTDIMEGYELDALILEYLESKNIIKL